MAARSCTVDFSFPHQWQAKILERPSLIGPAQHYIFPQAIEEVEIGALQILLQSSPDVSPVMATFALGFADLSLPHGLWSCPNPREVCAIAGGYAYIVSTDNPARWMQIPYRPVTAVHTAVQQQLLIFANFHQLWALAPEGKAWETERLSWEGLRVTQIEGQWLHGLGWDLQTDAEVPFTIDLATGRHTGGI